MKKRIFAMLMAAAMMLSWQPVETAQKKRKQKIPLEPKRRQRAESRHLYMEAMITPRINPAMDEHGEINILIF